MECVFVVQKEKNCGSRNTNRISWLCLQPKSENIIALNPINHNIPYVQTESKRAKEHVCCSCITLSMFSMKSDEKQSINRTQFTGNAFICAIFFSNVIHTFVPFSFVRWLAFVDFALYKATLSVIRKILIS